jgi:hypothetical protein
MVYSTRVAVLEPVDDLDEYALDQLILSEEGELSEYGVKVARAEVVDEEGIFSRIDLAMQGENVWVGRDSGMELGFASLIVVRLRLLNAFDCVVCSGLGIEGSIDNAESSRTQDCLDPERAVVNGLAQELGRRRRVKGHSGWVRRKSTKYRFLGT